VSKHDGHYTPQKRAEFQKTHDEIFKRWMGGESKAEIARRLKMSAQWVGVIVQRELEKRDRG